MALRAREFLVMKRRDLFEAAVTGELRLFGSPTGATLTGRATVVEGAAYLNEFLRPSGIDLSNPLYAQFVDTTVLSREALQPGPVERLVDSLRLDSVTVSLGDDFWLRSPDATLLDHNEAIARRHFSLHRLPGTIGGLMARAGWPADG